MLLRLLLATSMISLGLVILPTNTYACSCVTLGTPEEELAQSTLVFRGTVTSIGPPAEDGWLSVDFDVETVWKGNDTATISLTTHRDSATCGYPFEERVEYVIYSWDGVDVGLCSRTAPIDQAGEDLAAFDSGAQTAPDAGFPNTGNGGLAADDSGQERWAAIAAIAVAGTLMLGFAGARQYVRRQARPDDPTNVDRT